MDRSPIGDGSTRVVGLAVDHPSYEADHVARLVRAALHHAGLGVSDCEAPLRDLVPPGGTVLVKPNWVTHANEGGGGNECLVTHPSFVLAALREVLSAGAGRVVLGDAPIQRCDWNALIPDSLRSGIIRLSQEFATPIDLVDFRRTVMRPHTLSVSVVSNVRGAERYVLFDLGAESLLEDISGAEPRFRVAHYDPDELAKTHRPGRHQYLLCREVFEADLVLSLPKLKTHCKAGITGAIKNLVGLNGNKDFLPHHRIHGSDRGGDCYPGRSTSLELAERLEDATNRRLGRRGHGVWLQLSRAARLLAGGAGGRMTGAWHGNDTVWRMVLDLNRIVRYGRSDGTLAETPLRRIHSLTDAIVCGQGEGPLRPEPLPVGAVTFGQDPLACEIIHAALLGLEPRRIPLLVHATDRFRWPLGEPGGEILSSLGKERLTPDQVADAWGVAAVAPAGWAGRIERVRPEAA